MDFATIRNNLERLGYRTAQYATRHEAAAAIAASTAGLTVGFGGSMTLEEMGLYEALARRNTVYWHWRAGQCGGMDADAVRRAAATADIYFSSVNALAVTGEIVNIDGTCNRIAGMLYGHSRVCLIAGRNKIAPDLASAIDRARNTAAPLNARRLGLTTPCAAKADRCHDCRSPQRICRALSVMWEKPAGCAYDVVLIDEDLGY